MLNYKSLLFKEKYYCISYKLKFILKSNLSEIRDTNCKLITSKEDIIYMHSNSKFAFVTRKQMITFDEYESLEYYQYNKLHREDDKPTAILYCEGKIKYIRFLKNGYLHRESDKPSIIEFDENENIIEVSYYKNDLCHRDNDKPALLIFDNIGIIILEQYYKNGRLHREGDKPAYIRYDSDTFAYFKKYYYGGRLYYPNIDTYNNKYMDELNRIQLEYNNIHSQIEVDLNNIE